MTSTCWSLCSSEHQRCFHIWVNSEVWSRAVRQQGGVVSPSSAALPASASSCFRSLLFSVHAEAWTTMRMDCVRTCMISFVGVRVAVTLVVFLKSFKSGTFSTQSKCFLLTVIFLHSPTPIPPSRVGACSVSPDNVSEIIDSSCWCDVVGPCAPWVYSVLWI